jgi:flavin reductase (DIM6/NTAB) family NADH-FMN oxidoreductase RutF
MAVAIRGSATARFYRTFHAWSRLGSASHQQRRCFTPTRSIREANDTKPTNSRRDAQHVQTSESPNKQHDPDTRFKTPPTLKTTEHKIPADIFATLEQHPTYLRRIQDELDVKIEPTDIVTEDNRRIVRVTAKGNSAQHYVRSLLTRHAHDAQTLDNTVFESREVRKNKTAVLKLSLSSEELALLQDNNDELRLRIAQTFAVRLDIEHDQRATAYGMRSVTITGERRAITSAKDFIQSLHLDLDQSSQLQQDRVERPLANPSTPSSVSSRPARTGPRSSTQASPQSNTQTRSQPSPQTSTQTSPQPRTRSTTTNLKHDYKATMRSVPSSVVVLTTRASSADLNIDSLRGMTVSSMSSVTLEPEPIISFSIRGPSRTLDCITAGQPFTVNFLNTHPTGAHIADIFSRPHDDPSQPFRIINDSGLADIYESSDPAGPAIGGIHIPARFTCELLPGKSLEIGDHTVVFARVTDIWNVPSGPSTKKRTFLAYAQAEYRGVQASKIPLTNLETLKRTQPAKSAPVPSEKSAHDLQNKRVRVGNLPLTARAQDVKRYLKEAGFALRGVQMTITDDQNPSYCFARFYSLAESERAVRTLDGASFMDRSLKVTLAPDTRGGQNVKTPEAQVFDETASIEPAPIEPAAIEPASADPASTEHAFIELTPTESDLIESASTEAAESGLVDAYWQMALDEDNKTDVLEERAADQRALGEAQTPADLPAPSVENGKQDK